MRAHLNHGTFSRMTSMILGAVLACGAVTPAFARGHGHHAPPPAYGEGANNAYDAHDDRRDLTELNLSVNQWMAARARYDYWGEVDADRRIQGWLQREVAENRQEVAEAQAEVAQGRALVRESARAAAYEARTGMYTGAAARHQANLNALRDDQLDLARKIEEADRNRHAWNELSAMQAQFDARAAGPGLYQRKTALYRSLQADALAELNGDRHEGYEDGLAMGYGDPYPPAPRPGRR